MILIKETEMSEQKASRTLAEVQTDYQTLCMKAGHTQYQLYVLNADLVLMNSEIRDLNLEAAAIQQESAAKQAAQIAEAPRAEQPKQEAEKS